MQCTNKPVCSKLLLYVKNEDGVMVWAGYSTAFVSEDYTSSKKAGTGRHLLKWECKGTGN